MEMEKKPVPKAVEKGLDQHAVAGSEKTEKQLKEGESTSKLHIETTRPSETKAVITVEINDAFFKAERDKLLNQEQVKQDALKDQITSLQKQIQQLEKSEKDLQSKHETARRESERLNILVTQKEDIVKKAVVKETELNGRVVSLQKENQQLRKFETDLRAKYETAQRESERLKILVAQKEETVKKATEKETKLEGHVASLQNENQQFRISEKNLSSQNKTLHDLATKLQKQVAEKEEIAKKASSKLAELEGCITSLEKKIEERKKSENELKFRNQTLLDSETKLKKIVAEKNEIIESYNKKELITLNSLESLKKQIEDIRKSEKEVRAKNGHLADELKAVTTQKKAVEAEIRKQQNEKISANREIRILNQREENVFFIIQQLARKIESLKEESSGGHIATSKMKVIDYTSIMRDLKHKASTYNKEELWTWLQVPLQLVHEPSMFVLKESEKLVAVAAPEKPKREPEMKIKKPYTASIDFGTCFCTWAYTSEWWPYHISHRQAFKTDSEGNVHANGKF